MAKLLGAINLERETKCRTAITVVIGSVTFQIVLRCAHTLHLTASRNKTLHKMKHSKNSCLSLATFVLKNNVQTEMKRNVDPTSVSLSLSQGPLSNANSTLLLRSMFDCNQNVSCQLSVVKRCFSIVDLIKFCMSLTCACRKFGVEI